MPSEDVTVGHVSYNNQIFDANSVNKADAGCQALSRVAVLCNRAAHSKSDLRYDASLLKFSEHTLGSVIEYRAKHRKLAEIPFEYDNLYQLSIHELADDPTHLLLVMTVVPEQLVRRCTTCLVNGEDCPMDMEHPEMLMDFDEKCNQLFDRGERVIALCDLKLARADYPAGFEFNTEEPNFPVKGLRFVGLISFADPPPASLPKTVADCRAADTRVIMISGSWCATAKAIAKSVGIIAEGSETVDDIARRLDIDPDQVNPSDARAHVVNVKVLGDRIDRTDGDWKESLDQLFDLHSELVFARASPENKRQIVDYCQTKEEKIAIYGRGVEGPLAIR